MDEGKHMKLIRLFFSCIIATLIVSNAHSQWAKLDGPYSENIPTITCLTELKGTLVAVTQSNDAIFMSTDNGMNWSLRSSGLNLSHVHALVSSDSCIFAGTTYGVFVSGDNGVTWTSVNSG